MNDTDITRFFDRYAEVSMADDPQAVAAMYAPSFLVAGPQGSATFPNDDAFIEWLQGVHAANVQTGMSSMRVAGLTDVRHLSSTHAIVTVEWEARFEKTGDTPIRFEITYTLEDLGAGPKILAYISHVDQEDEMRRLGLM